MSINEWAAIAAIVTFIVSAIAVSAKLTITYYLNELRPNGGSSIKDSINRIEMALARLEGKFEQHVEESDK